MSLEEYISLQGPLAETFPQLDPATILHADELTNARRTNPELRSQWFYTADGAIYTVENNQAVLYLTRGKDNPVFKHIEEATQQLIENHNYFPSQEDLEAAINSESTVRIVLNKLKLKRPNYELLKLKRPNDEFFYIEFGPANQNLDEEEEKLFQRAFGQGNNFKQNKEMFSDAEIEKSRVYVLNPDYVRETLKKINAPALARTGLLSDFGYVSGFEVGVWNVDDDSLKYHCLFGVPRSSQARAESLSQNSGVYRNPDAGHPNLEIALQTVLEASQEYVPDAIRETYEAKIREALGKIF